VEVGLSVHPSLISGATTINWHEAEAVSPLGEIGGAGIVVVDVVVVVVVDVVDLGMVVDVVVDVESGTVVDVVVVVVVDVVDLGMVVDVDVDVESGTVVFMVVDVVDLGMVVDVVVTILTVVLVVSNGGCVGLVLLSVVVVAPGARAPRTVVEVALEPVNVMDVVDVAGEDGGRDVVVEAPLPDSSVVPGGVPWAACDEPP